MGIILLQFRYRGGARACVPFMFYLEMLYRYKLFFFYPEISNVRTFRTVSKLDRQIYCKKKNDFGQSSTEVLKFDIPLSLYTRTYIFSNCCFFFFFFGVAADWYCDAVPSESHGRLAGVFG